MTTPMNSLNRDQWKEVDDQLKAMEIRSYDEGGGFTSHIGSLDNVGEILAFLHSELEKVRQEAFINGFKKGQIKGALDKEWGQTTAEEKLQEVRQETIKECMEALPKKYLEEDIDWDNDISGFNRAINQATQNINNLDKGKC